MTSTRKSHKAKPASRTAPWDRDNPKSTHHKHLTTAQKAKAKRRAQRAGRRYPNLVDNMRVAAEADK